MSSASGGFRPLDFITGFRPWTPLGIGPPKIQARSQDCQNEEADRSSAPSPPFSSSPYPPLLSLRSRPLKSS